MNVEVQPGYTIYAKSRKAPYRPGEQLDLDEKEARRLIDSGIVKQAAATASAGGRQLNVNDTVALVMATQTSAELDTLAEGEERKGVLAAIEKRRAELTQPSGDQ